MQCITGIMHCIFVTGRARNASRCKCLQCITLFFSQKSNKKECVYIFRFLFSHWVGRCSLARSLAQLVVGTCNFFSKKIQLHLYSFLQSHLYVIFNRIPLIILLLHTTNATGTLPSTPVSSQRTIFNFSPIQ